MNIWEGNALIYASGVVSFLSKSTETIGKFNLENDIISMKVVEKNELRAKDLSGSVVKITCTFRAILPRSYECKSLEDYTGKIKPFLQKSLNNIIISVEIRHLNYSSKNRLVRDPRKT